MLRSEASETSPSASPRGPACLLDVADGVVLPGERVGDEIFGLMKNEGGVRQMLLEASLGHFEMEKKSTVATKRCFSERSRHRSRRCWSFGWSLDIANGVKARGYA